MTVPRLIPLARALVLRVYQRHLDDSSDGRVYEDEVPALFEVKISKNLINSALDFARRDGFVSRQTDDVRRKRYYRIRADGIRFVENQLGIDDSDLCLLNGRGEGPWLDHAKVGNVSELRLNPGPKLLEESLPVDADELRPDEVWEPLPLDRQSTEYLNAVENAEKALEVVRGNNGYRTAEPEEHARVTASLETGLDWLKNRVPSRGVIIAFLWAPLGHLANKFSDSLIGEVAKIAAKAVWDLVSKHI
jgi:hypothetical protein